MLSSVPDRWIMADIVPACSFISENPLIAKLQYGLKITFIFILILFLDSFNRVYRVQLEIATMKEGGAQGYVTSKHKSERVPC